LFVENGIANALLSLARKLGLEFTNETQNQQLDILIDTVANLQKPCLLILDNANNEKDLNANIISLRKCSNFHILLTSRLDKFEKAQKHSIGALSEKDALAVFKEHYEHLQEAEIPLFKQIFEAIGGNTLVLEILAKNCNAFSKPEPEYPLQTLFDDLQKSLFALSKSKEIEIDQTDKNNPKRLLSGKPEDIILAMYNISELSENELIMLNNFSVLPAENIALDTLKVLIDYESLKDSLVSLHRKGWIEKSTTEGKNYYKISPVVQEITRHKNQERLFADCEGMILELNEGLNYLENPERFHQENYKYATLYSHYAESVVNHLTELHPHFSILYERIGTFHEITGSLNQALKFYEWANTVDEKLVAQNPTNLDYKDRLAISYEKLGNTHRFFGNLDKSLKFFKKYNQYAEKFYEVFPTNVKIKNNLAISYSRLGETYRTSGNLSKALVFFNKYNQLAKKIYDYYPTNENFKESLGWSYQCLGIIYLDLEDLDKALNFFENMAHLFKKLYEFNSTNIEYKNGLALSYQFLGDTYSRLNNLEQALYFFEKFNDLMQELYTDNFKNVSFKNNLAISYLRLGEIQRGLDNLEKSLEFLKKSKQLSKELYESYLMNVNFKNAFALCCQWLGQTQEELNDKQKAKINYLESQKLLLELTKNFPAYIEFQQNLQWVENRLKSLE